MRVSPVVHVLLLLHHGKISGLILPPCDCMTVLGHGHAPSCLRLNMLASKLISLLELLDLLALLLIVVLRRKLLLFVFVPIILKPGGEEGGG